jgi:hypothetical protein
MAAWAPVTVLLRVLGVELMAQLGRRLPTPAARLLSAVMLVGANLMPVWAVMEGRLGMGDVLVIYWFENVIIWFTTTVRILTTTKGSTSGTRGLTIDLGGLTRRLSRASWVTGDPALAVFFALHYGIFTLVHGVFTAILAGMAGLHGSPLDWVASVAALLLSHTLSLGLSWFGRGERAVVGAGWVMAAPYPRLLALHLTVLLGFFLLGGPNGRTAHDVGAVVLLMGGKTVLDLAFMLGTHRFLARRAVVGGRAATSTS